MVVFSGHRVYNMYECRWCYLANGLPEISEEQIRQRFMVLLKSYATLLSQHKIHVVPEVDSYWDVCEAKGGGSISLNLTSREGQDSFPDLTKLGSRPCVILKTAQLGWSRYASCLLASFAFSDLSMLHKGMTPILWKPCLNVSGVLAVMRVPKKSVMRGCEKFPTVQQHWPCKCHAYHLVWAAAIWIRIPPRP